MNPMFSFISVRGFCRSTRPVGKLEGKVAVVTASTKGIGFEIAKKLAEDGAHVVISSRKQSNVEKAIENLKFQSLKVSGLACNVSNKDDRQKIINLLNQDHKKLDILVSNAAAHPFSGPTMQTPESCYDDIFDINVKSAFMLIKEMTPLMVGSLNPSITIVSSVGGFVPFNNLGIHCVSKTAIIGLTKVLSGELASKNIRVNSICPGVIKTEMSDKLIPAAEAKIHKKATPLGRFGEPYECSGLVSFLASEEASYITGENIVIGGGVQSRL